MNSFQIYIAVRQVSMHPVPTSTPLKNRYSHPIPSFCYVVEKKRRHILPICHFLCFFFISINLNNSMHFRQSSNNKYLYLLLFQSHCRWDSLFQTCLSFPVFQSRYRMRLSILEVDTDRTGVRQRNIHSQPQLLLPGLLVLVSVAVAVQTELRIHTGVICDRNVISDLV